MHLSGFFEDTWHHVAAVFNGTQSRTGELVLYLDGVRIGHKIVPENSIPTRTGKDKKSPLIGADSSKPTEGHFWGSVDKLRISNKAAGSRGLREGHHQQS